MLADGSEIFLRIYFSSNDRIFAIKKNDITLASISETPEPATWMTMIPGFGMVGYALRRSRKTRNAAIAWNRPT